MSGHASNTVGQGRR